MDGCGWLTGWVDGIWMGDVLMGMDGWVVYGWVWMGG